MKKLSKIILCIFTILILLLSIYILLRQKKSNTPSNINYPSNTKPSVSAKPRSDGETKTPCNTASNCKKGEACKIIGPIIANQKETKVCVPIDNGQVQPF